MLCSRWSALVELRIALRIAGATPARPKCPQMSRASDVKAWWRSAKLWVETSYKAIWHNIRKTSWDIVRRKTWCLISFQSIISDSFKDRETRVYRYHLEVTTEFWQWPCRDEAKLTAEPADFGRLPGFSKEIPSCIVLLSDRFFVLVCLSREWMGMGEGDYAILFIVLMDY